MITTARWLIVILILLATAFALYLHGKPYPRKTYDARLQLACIAGELLLIAASWGAFS